ncbi:MAG: hypothetical protein ACI3ZN_01825 [Candidatus Cryptobacteroides sp.]
MKPIFRLMLAFLPFLFVGCGEKEVIFGTENLGKPKPTVEIVLDRADRFGFEFTLKQSDDSQQFGYVILEKTEEMEVPTPYSIVTGGVEAAMKAVFNEADYRQYYFSQRVTAPAGMTFIIYAAAITSEGVLSELSEYVIEMPEKVPFKQGIFTTRGDNLSPNVVSKYAGEPFVCAFEILETATVDYALYQANWFNFLTDEYGSEQVFNPVLIGIVDYENNVIRYDGQFVYNGSFSPYSAFGQAFMYYNEERVEYLVFLGGGDSGDQDILMPFDKEGNILGMSDCGYGIFDKNSNFIGYFDRLQNGKLTYLRGFGEPASSNTFRSLAPEFERILNSQNNED